MFGCFIFQVFLGACGFTITEFKKSKINMTVPVSTEWYVFLVSRPKELSRAMLFIMPFTSGTWLCIVGAVMLIALLLNVFHRLSPYYEYYKLQNNKGLNKMTNCLWYIYGALLQQGGGYLPTANSGRVIVGTWWLVVIIVVTTYCGNLVAFLTFPKMDYPITNIHDLLDRKNQLTWGITKSSTLNDLLKISDSPSLSELYKMAQIYDDLTPEIIENIRRGKHVFIQRKTILLFITKKEYLTTNSCDFSLGIIF
uniref:Ionotropic glutamate receptor C-terminal domain-containing protein n=1 Tax=Clastoptera arizonana TaxID=38151 RepID=A0A1B6DGV5_9HEMI